MLQCLSSTKPLRDYCLRKEFHQEQPSASRAQQELTEGRQVGREELCVPVSSCPVGLSTLLLASHSKQGAVWSMKKLISPTDQLCINTSLSWLSQRGPDLDVALHSPLWKGSGDGTCCPGVDYACLMLGYP